MKKFILPALLATGLANAALAAFTTGLETGYLTDSKDAYWAGRGGWEFNAGGSLSHQVELELGHTRHSESLPGGGPFRITMKLMPITINYRAETMKAEKLGFYYGAGLGQARVRLSVPGSGVPIVSDSATAFAFQAFAGASYKLTAAASLVAGAKYINVNDDITVLGVSSNVGDDLALTGGISVRF